MDNKLVFEVKESEVGMKLGEYLRKVASFSGRLIKGAAIQGRIRINGNIVKLNYVLKSKDIIEFDVVKEESQNIEPEKMDIDVVFEDKDIIVVNKSPGMVVHPTKSYQSGTLANGLLYYFKEKGENCIVRLVSRLDMDTSGLIIVAKNQFSHMALARDMQRKDFEKSYYAIVHGNMKDKKGTIDLPIYRDEEAGIRRVIDDRGQRSITHYEVVKSFNNADLVRLTLETGRTHQIRVHLSYLGHPIYGDSLYGENQDEDFINRQALHAYKLAFPHPRTSQITILETDIPNDMKCLIEKISR